MTTDLNALIGAAQEAERWYLAKKRETQVARNAEVDALNGLNATQKAVDDAMLKFRKESTHESDWGRQKLRVAPAIPGLERP